MARLPIISSASSLRASRTSKWRAGVLIGIHVIAGIHITHWLVTGSSVTPVEPSEAMAFSMASIVNAGLIFFAVAILLTLIFGRLFCGWACHLVALQDLCRWWLAKLGIRPQPLRSRLLRWVPFLAFFYMFLWPAVYRLWIGDSFRPIQTELTTEHFWATFPGWTIGILTFAICGFVIVYLLGAKGFCTYACPYGAIFTLADRVAPWRIRVTDDCRQCGHCTATCTSNVRVHEEVHRFGMVVDDGCMKCLDCVSVCPNDALYYGPGGSRRQARSAATLPAAPPQTTPSWPEEGLLAAAFTLAFFTFRGLYGMVPFLMALGLAAVLAYLVLIGFRLLRRPNLTLRQFRLKARGRLLPAGRVFVVALMVLVAFWAHSAYLRAQDTIGSHYYRQISGLRYRSFDTLSGPPRLTATELRPVHRARDALERVDRWGLFPTRGNAARLAWLYYLSGAPAELADSAQTAIDRGEAAPEMEHLLALEALGEDNLERALMHLQRAVDGDPSRAQTWVHLGLAHIEKGDLQAAGRAFEQGLQSAPESPELLYNAGLVRALTGDAEGAIELFEEAVRLAPTNLAARENLAGILASVGRFEESVVHFRAAIEQTPDDAQTHFLLARALLGMGDLSGALAALDRCLALEPGHQEAIILRASVESQPAE